MQSALIRHVRELIKQPSRKLIWPQANRVYKSILDRCRSVIDGSSSTHTVFETDFNYLLVVS